MSQEKQHDDAEKLNLNQTNHKVSTTLPTFPLVEVRCPNIREHKGRKIRCNFMAMQMEFGRGTTKCRSCHQLFSFEINTTFIKFDKAGIANEPFDVLE